MTLKGSGLDDQGKRSVKLYNCIRKAMYDIPIATKNASVSPWINYDQRENASNPTSSSHPFVSNLISTQRERWSDDDAGVLVYWFPVMWTLMGCVRSGDDIELGPVQ